ncbi:MAG: hypothetical protein V4596_08930 [Bdellovibrionota bacterium]
MIKAFVIYILIGLAIAGTSMRFAEAASKAEDLVILNQARKLYEKNELDKAIAKYEQISKDSDFWVESVEEKAWAYTRKQDYNSAIGALKSTFNAVFSPYIGPETYVLSAFVDLKICDYKSAFDKIALYKAEMLPRVEALEAIVQNPNSEFVNTWVQKLSKGDITRGEQLGKDLTKLPRFIQREAKKMTNTRMKALAQKDLEEISKNLKKMKIIEVEVAQRSFVYEKEKPEKLKFDKRKSADILVFPDEQESGEVWLDEIGKYEVKTNKCPTAGGKS